MIDSEVFRTSRMIGRSKLSPEEGRNSYGYWIDIPNDWESYSCPEDLILFLGIHLTHIQKFAEVVEDLGTLTAREFDWVKRYVAFADRIARLLTTTGRRVDLKHDLAETLADWRVIERFATQPCRVLDFGAGCGRQGLSAFLRDPRNIYTAVDATLAAYTLQNLMLSYMDTLAPQASFHDFLDYEKAGRPLPDIRAARPGDRYHVPCWYAEAHAPERYFDVIIAAHVHNELSGPDFMRLVRVVERSLAPDGIFYVRSELTWGDTRDYFDAIDFHGIELLAEMRARSFFPVWSRFTNGYLTTVFARAGSAPYGRARASSDPDNRFLECTASHEISSGAAGNYLRRCGEALVAAKGRTAFVCSGDAFDRQFVEPIVQKRLLKDFVVYGDQDLLGSSRAKTLAAIKEYAPESVVIGSQSYPAIEGLLNQTLGADTFRLRRYCWYPVVFLHRRSLSGADGVFDRPILRPEDLEPAAGTQRR